MKTESLSIMFKELKKNNDIHLISHVSEIVNKKLQEKTGDSYLYKELNKIEDPIVLEEFRSFLEGEAEVVTFETNHGKAYSTLFAITFNMGLNNTTPLPYHIDNKGINNVFRELDLIDKNDSMIVLSKVFPLNGLLNSGIDGELPLQKMRYLHQELVNTMSGVNNGHLINAVNSLLDKSKNYDKNSETTFFIIGNVISLNESILTSPFEGRDSDTDFFTMEMTSILEKTFPNAKDIKVNLPEIFYKSVKNNIIKNDIEKIREEIKNKAIKSNQDFFLRIKVSRNNNDAPYIFIEIVDKENRKIINSFSSPLYKWSGIEHLKEIHDLSKDLNIEIED